jgi:sulfur relay protein TusB/DsrH
MKTAFIVLKSPQESDPSHMLSRLAHKADATAILFEDGVYQAVSQHSANKLKTSAEEVLVSGEDLAARGFTASDLKVGRAVGYPEIVDCIMERTERTITL